MSKRAGKEPDASTSSVVAGPCDEQTKGLELLAAL